MERKKLDKGKQEFSTLGYSSSGKPAKEAVSVIVKVKKPGYVPEGFQVRSRINDYLFTAESTLTNVATHTDDNDIESITTSSRSQMID